MKRFILECYFFLFFILILLLLSQNSNAQILKYNEVKSKGLMLDSNSKSHQIFIIINNFTADYLLCDIYIYGKYLIDFSKIEFAKIIFKEDYIKTFVQFSSYYNYFNQKEDYPYCETFKIELKEEDVLKIIENKNEIIFFQFEGKYGSINAILTKRFISNLEKLSFEEDLTQTNLTINTRPYSFFALVYPINLYYNFDNSNDTIDKIAPSLIFNNNFNLEMGFYFKIPILSAISLYFYSANLFDWQESFEIVKILGIKTYLTIFDIPESIFLRFSFMFGILGNGLNSNSISKYDFSWSSSLILGIPISTSVEYITCLSIGKLDRSEFILIFQFGIILNLF